MIAFGPVAEAAHRGQTSPAFDLPVGFLVLGMTWFGFWKKREQNPVSIWIAVAVTVICAVFVFEGVRQLLR